MNKQIFILVTLNKMVVIISSGRANWKRNIFLSNEASGLRMSEYKQASAIPSSTTCKTILWSKQGTVEMHLTGTTMEGCSLCLPQEKSSPWFSFFTSSAYWKSCYLKSSMDNVPLETVNKIFTAASLKEMLEAVKIHYTGYFSASLLMPLTPSTRSNCKVLSSKLAAHTNLFIFMMTCKLLFKPTDKQQS